MMLRREKTYEQLVIFGIVDIAATGHTTIHTGEAAKHP